MKKVVLIAIPLIFVSSFTDFQINTEKENEKLGFEIAALFRAFRKTIAVNKEAINNPNNYFKEPHIKVNEITVKAKKYYKEMTGKVYPDEKQTRSGKVRYLLEKAVRQVILAISKNKQDLFWKGENSYIKKWDGKLLPARFANRVALTFNRLTSNKVRIKLTTSNKLLVNKDNAPDQWESEMIDNYLLNTRQGKTKAKFETDKRYFRYILPEFYGKNCISCHGTNRKQEGYKIHPSKIKRKLYDFAGAISVSFTI